MGGTTSKFEETDWIRADGKLSATSETIDGRPPTSGYGVYYLTKLKLNQREFEVTDLEKNLLYTTKCVPGTLCWFDVYGREMDDCLLRVQVDLSRRYWLIYRMGIPCFAGQLADREATDKLANDRRETGQDLTATPFLFRKVCVCVSWSRYMAVAMQYGAPEGIDLLERRKNNGISEDSESSFFHHAAQITARMRKRGSEESLLEEEEENEDDDNKDHTRRSSATETNDNDDSNNPYFFSYDATNDVAALDNDKGNTSLSSISEHASTADLVVQRTTEMRNSITEWVVKKQKEIQDNKKKQMRSDPLEGILHLEKPILLCQEIYDSLIGTHQSSLLSKKRAIEYLREDLEKHMKDGGYDSDDPFLADQEGIRAQLEALRRAEEEAKNGSSISSKETKATSASTGSSSQDDEATEKETTDRVSSPADIKGNNNETHTTPEEKQPGDERSVEVDVDDVDAINHDEPKDSGSAREVDVDEHHHDDAHVEKKPDTSDQKENNNNDADEQDPEVDPEDDESLIGFWKWDNTWKVHQMKMHVAGGSDLALHVVMAIIVNQVRYERNAIAMTV